MRYNVQRKQIILSEQARNEVFGWGNNGSGVLELRGYVHANGHQVGEASASQTVELKRLSLQVASNQTTDQETGEILGNWVDVLPADIVTAGGGIDTAQTARNLAQRVYAGFAALSAEAQARVVAYVQGEIQTVISSPYFTELSRVSLYNHIDVSDLVTGDEQLITDYAYQAIGGDEGLPGGVVSRHVVRAGESLQSIAAAYYGSPSYWYLIAEANGLEGSEELKAGTTLSIPNAVANSVNDKESYKVYSESEIIGSTSPEVRVKQKKSKWYQKLVMVIIAVIVVVVAVYTGYIATELVATYGAVAGTVTAAAVGYAAGVATSAVTQGLAIAVDLQEEFDWKAAREMGQDFAITAVAAGATSAIGKANTLGKVLARGAVQMGRQYAESGKVTNWSGVALAMVGQSGVSATSNWASTVSFVNKHRNLLSSGLSVVEKFARGKDVNTLDWTNVAASAIGGQGSVTSVYSQADGINWGEVAKQSLISGGLSLAVGHRFGEAAGLNFFGNQLGAMVGNALVDKARAERESTRVMNAETVVQITEDASPYERQAQMNQQAEARKSAEQTEAQAIADEQQSDRDWMLDAPDEGRSGVTTYAYGTNPSDDRLTITTEVDGLPIGQGLSQTNPAPQTTAQGELANFAAFEVGDQNYSSIDYMEPIPGSEQSNLGTYLAAPEPMTDSPSTDDIPSQNYTDSSLDTGPIITELESNFNQYTVHQEVGLDTVTTGGTLGGLYAKVYDPFGNQYEGVDNDTVTAFENAYIEARRISANREAAYQDAAIGGGLGFGLGQGLGLAIEAATPLVASTARNLFGSVKGLFRSGDEVGLNKFNRTELVKELIVDSNKKFPLTEINANKMLDEFVPEGFKPRTVAGPGGQGADLVLEGPNGQIFKIENKSTQSFRGFDKEISHAAQNQASGNLVFVQVPKGTDASKWMARYWGNRTGIFDSTIPENVAKLNVYKNTDIVVFDPNGNLLLPRQPIYNPPK
ncbi:MAG: LysM peptidoglycan-binding domain-containing protein [Candidatus Thiodiazotropha sp.]